MQLEAKFEYGDVVTDSYSGFQGKVTAVCFYQTGCTQYCVNAGKLKEDGKPLDGEWFDETRLENVSQNRTVSGGPRRNPPSVG